MPILKVENLSISLAGQITKKLTRDVSFEINEGEIFSLVGESGSGKTITSLAVAGIYPYPSGFKEQGTIYFNQKDISTFNEEDWCHIRGKEIAMIFQEPASALNPLLKIGPQLFECLKFHSGESKERVLDLLKRVGFAEPNRILNSWPHELSGGMQQRVMIAMALIHRPKLLIADEPTTALDVTIQAQILDLLLDLQAEMGMAILFITHNLALVAQYADRLAVMQNGCVVESNDVVTFFKSPQCEYSKELIAAIPGKRKFS